MKEAVILEASSAEQCVEGVHGLFRNSLNNKIIYSSASVLLLFGKMLYSDWLVEYCILISKIT